MPFQEGSTYSRYEICAALGLGRDEHAVLVVEGVVVAIVVNEIGLNPYSSKRFSNALTPETFTMGGENDDRGRLLEQSGQVRLFFRREGESKYQYEGIVRYKQRVDVPGAPIREFNRGER